MVDGAPPLPYPYPYPAGSGDRGVGFGNGEAAALQWSDIDFAKGVLVLDRTKTDDPRAWRLGPDVVRALEAYREGHREPKADGHIFVDETGASYEAPKLAQTFRDDLKRAKVKRTQLFERTPERMPIRLNDLRATLARAWTPCRRRSGAHRHRAR